jgi:hypothetical protein
VDAGDGVAEPVGDLGGGHLVEEVGAQRLIPVLRRAGGCREVLCALYHLTPQRVLLKYLPKGKAMPVSKNDGPVRDRALLRMPDSSVDEQSSLIQANPFR